MRAEFAGTCDHCGEPIKPGHQIIRVTSGWVHAPCPEVRLGPVCPKCFLTRPCEHDE